ncbi:MAG TPA: hypothetical protein VM940_02640 [Chthoniobacterales bacterium]|jgi:hypothetical protein|nr:hypothetical protein [Chthoniobacterales bacterium]
MKIIPKFYHGVLDYLSGLLLLAGPNLLGFADLGGATVWVPRIFGLIILLQALMTDYELGLIKVIPITLHLMADYLLSAFLLLAPFLLGISGRSITATMLLVVMAIVGFAAALMTEPRGRPREMMS